MSLLLSDPGSSVPGALTPGTADPGFPDSEQWGGYVTLDTVQVISGGKTFTAPAYYDGSSHWYGAATAQDITVLPNTALSASASMFLDNNAGQVYEFYCDNGAQFGVFDKTANSQVLLIGNAAHGHGATFSGALSSQNNTLDDGAGKLITTNDVHAGQWLYVAGSVVGSGGYAAAVVTKTANYAAGLTDSTILASGAITVTLPSTGSVAAGRIYTVKQTAAASATVATTSSQTIDGATTCTLPAQYKYVTVQSDGSNWFIIASN